MTVSFPKSADLPDWGSKPFPVLSIREYTAIQITNGLVARGLGSPILIAKQAILITDALLRELDESRLNS
jgi:hypothetical protein